MSTSTVPVAPIEEKVAVLDERAAKAGTNNTAKDYAMKFACASMSSEYMFDASVDSV